MDKKNKYERFDEHKPVTGASSDVSKSTQLLREARSVMTDAQHAITHDRHCEKLLDKKK